MSLLAMRLILLTLTLAALAGAESLQAPEAIVRRSVLDTPRGQRVVITTHQLYPSDPVRSGQRRRPAVGPRYVTSAEDSPGRLRFHTAPRVAHTRRPAPAGGASRGSLQAATPLRATSVIPGSRRGRYQFKHPTPQSLAARRDVSVIPGSRRGRYQLQAAPQSLAARRDVSVIPGSRRGRYQLQAAPQSLAARRDVSVIPGSRQGRYQFKQPTPQPLAARTGVSAAQESARRPHQAQTAAAKTPCDRAESAGGCRVLEIPPVYRNLCRQRASSTLSQLPAPLRSVCRDYWRLHGGGAAQADVGGAQRRFDSSGDRSHDESQRSLLSAGEAYVGPPSTAGRPRRLGPGEKYVGPAGSGGRRFLRPSVLSGRRRRHRTRRPSSFTARRRERVTATNRLKFYKPYWPYKRNGQLYY